MNELNGQQGVGSWQDGDDLEWSNSLKPVKDYVFVIVSHEHKIVQSTSHKWGWQAKYLMMIDLSMKLARRWRWVDGMLLPGNLSNLSWTHLVELGIGWDIDVSVMYRWVIWVISLVFGGVNVYPSIEYSFKSNKFCTSRYGLVWSWNKDLWKIEIHLQMLISFESCYACNCLSLSFVFMILV